MTDSHADQETVEAIRTLAEKPELVRVTRRAQYDLWGEHLTKDDICREVIAWIEAGKPVEKIITAHVAEFMGDPAYVIKPEINGREFYIKVTIVNRDEWNEVLLIISTHP